MSTFKLFTKSLLYYWKINVASILATALCVAVITGALIIGDSVKYSLHQITSQRLGKTAFVLNAGDKLFRQQLANDLAVTLQIKTSPLFQSQGIVSKNGGEVVATNVQVNGIDSTFFGFAPQGLKHELPAFDEVYINIKLAKKLELKPDDFILIKIKKHEDVSLNSPFISTDRQFVTLLAKVKNVLNDSDFGRFSLRNDQVSPYNVFLNIDQLNAMMGQENSANIILIAAKKEIGLADLQHTLKNVWKLSDVSLSVREIVEQQQIEIQSDQIFIHPHLLEGAKKVDKRTDFIFTYLVNSIENKKHATPYSFVSAKQSLNLQGNEIILNKWLAKDLRVSINDTVLLKYYTIGPLRRLMEESKGFIVKDVVEIKGYAADKTLMPNFPGLANVDNCRDWNAGVTIDLEKIRDKDEKYWDDFGGTPKAFIAYKTAKEIWQNDFGAATSIRFSSTNNNPNNLTTQLLPVLDPAKMGLQLIPVKQLGLAAVNNSIDFSELFLGMSFFIVLAALLLIGLFFHLNTEYRNKEIAFYHAAGFTKKHISQLLLSEGFIIVLLGGIIGVGGAVLYNNILLKAINTVWVDMVKTNILFVKIYPESLAVGYFSGALCALVTLYFSIQSKLKKSVVGLQKDIDQTIYAPFKKKRSYAKTLFFTSIVLMLVFTIIYFVNLVPDVSIAFFVYGTLLLLIGLSGFSFILKRGALHLNAGNISFISFCVANLSKNKKRSLLIVSMMAIGVYLVISTGANRQYMLVDQQNPKSGTGGFLFYAQTTLPVIDDLNTSENRLKYGLEQADSFNLEILQLKTLDGDEASCFNLNQIKQPRLLGVDYKKLSHKKAFTFAKTLKGVDKDNPWSCLQMNMGKNTFPVVADQTVIQWSFGKKVGDTLQFQIENGDTVNMVLVGGLQNSLFQGNLLISDSLFQQFYPSIAGSKVLLVDGKWDNTAEILSLLNRNFRDFGLEISSSLERLTSFYSVQNTYLNVFILLGGIGLMIGTLGIGILIIRSVLERKHELALLRAVGFKKSRMLKIIWTENSILLFAGIMIGSLSAVLSTLPSFLEAGTQIPVNLIGIIMLVLMGFGWLVVYLSVVFSMKKNRVDMFN